jgi:hypothetical protein
MFFERTSFMKSLFSTTLSILTTLLFLTNAFGGTTYYVDATNGSDSKAGTSSAPWKTITMANSRLVAGDTVYIRQGTYSSQTIAPANNGTSGSPITYARYASETVTLSNASNGINIQGKNWIVIDGISVSYSSSSWVNARNSSHCAIRNCQFYDSRGWAGIALDGATYDILQGNSAQAGACGQTSGNNEDGCPGDLLGIDSGSYNYLSGNYWGKVPHFGITILGDSTKNIIDGDTFENPWHAALEFELGAADRNLVQNCTFKNMGTAPSDNPRERDRNSPIYWHMGIQLYDGGDQNIIRKNVFYNNGAAILFDSEGSTTANNRVYQNTIDGNEYGLYAYLAYSTASPNILKNNVITRSSAYGLRWSVSNGSNSLWANNNFYGNESNYYRGTTASDSTVLETSSSGFNASFGSEFVNSMNSNPSFNNWDTRAYSLTSESSSLVDKGTWLTTITSATGNGTSFTVADAGYFCDGWGIMAGDRIQIQGGTSSVGVKSVNYTTNSITVDTSIAWQKGYGVSLAFSGSAPDIGANEYSSEQHPVLAAPIGLSITQN